MLKFAKRNLACAGLILIAGSGYSVGAQGAEKFSASYSITLVGLPVAKSNFTTTISGDKFSVKGGLRSAGIGKLAGSTSGNTTVKGIIGKSQLFPQSFVTNYTSSKGRKSTRIKFRNGNAVSVSVSPKPKLNRKGYVPITKAHYQSVIDPLTAMMVKSPNLRSVCKHRLRILDGTLRADLALSGGTIKTMRTRGYKGKAIKCNARFIPIAGYRKGQKSIEYLRNKARISITFAENGSSGIYSPVRADISTYIGTIVVRATRFGPM